MSLLLVVDCLFCFNLFGFVGLVVVLMCLSFMISCCEVGGLLWLLFDCLFGLFCYDWWNGCVCYGFGCCIVWLVV